MLSQQHSPMFSSGLSPPEYTASLIYPCLCSGGFGLFSVSVCKATDDGAEDADCFAAAAMVGRTVWQRRVQVIYLRLNALLYSQNL